MSLAEASRLSDRGFSLRMARLQELKRNHARLLRIMAQLRENRERKKAAEQDKGVFDGWGSTGGAVAGGVAGGLIAGPPGVLIGARMGAGVGGGIDQATSGDLRGGTYSMTEAAEFGVEELDLFEHEFFSGGGGQTGFPGFRGPPGPG
jgi:hypothetical protein